ncbi:hypothetical protein BDV27DRAFT_31202 [Aspergillus caelatus]|uniref:Uncharacterized protein n=1 Tax=Aspergillus caelatus TaxID=61420 RepID=A0A5N6ZUB1_9EURO|nr:uncharacterized protein BDV27DRAFT_31202 [Aspergillus caelatus]KAE8361201.1 hypothetical protein BDV27DRAFT_31202 [Aspergillus caelatus]
MEQSWLHSYVPEKEMQTKTTMNTAQTCLLKLHHPNLSQTEPSIPSRAIQQAKPTHNPSIHKTNPPTHPPAPKCSISLPYIRLEPSEPINALHLRSDSQCRRWNNNEQAVSLPL